jgi:hypothetical protein
MKKLFILLSVSCISFLLISWGATGHYTISKKSTESFPASMSSFLIWADSLANHGSDADDRKSSDPNESMRHYIDIDNYAEFTATGRIPSTYDSVVYAHGTSFVENEGTLPWSTMKMYDSLKLAFQQHDWHMAMLHASDLGHYVGDGHMPLHITKNYNGQLTGQTGVHSRYESSMVGYNITALSNYTGDSVHLITDVNKYIFTYIYANYKYIDSVLTADTYAQNLAGNNNTSAYYQALFAKTQNFTTLLFHNASHALAELIYTAWTEAGSPQLTTGIYSDQASVKLQMTVYPNPVADFAIFSVVSPESSDAMIKISNLEGKRIITEKVNLKVGENHFKTDLTTICNGVYIATLTEQGKIHCLRFVVKR